MPRTQAPLWGECLLLPSPVFLSVRCPSAFLVVPSLQLPNLGPFSFGATNSKCSHPEKSSCPWTCCSVDTGVPKMLVFSSSVHRAPLHAPEISGLAKQLTYGSHSAASLTIPTRQEAKPKSKEPLSPQTAASCTGPLPASAQRRTLGGGAAATTARTHASEAGASWALLAAYLSARSLGSTAKTAWEAGLTAEHQTLGQLACAELLPACPSSLV